MDFNKYKNLDAVSSQPKRPVLRAKDNPEACRQHALDLEEYLEEYSAKLESQEWRKKQNKLAEQFKQDALAEVGLAGHPKADKAYAFAWEHGHASGLTEVFYWLEEIADLLI